MININKKLQNLNFKNTKFEIILIFIFFLLILFIFPLHEYDPTDEGIKVQQIKDIIHNHYNSFDVTYYGKEFDKGFNYFPMRNKSFYKNNDKIYYVFPFQISLLFLPFYKVAGVYGIISFNIVISILTIIICMKIGNILIISDFKLRLMAIFLGFCSIIPLYLTMIAEYQFVSFLVCISIYFLFKGIKDENNTFFFLSGLSAGSTTFFRIELGAFCVLMLVGIAIIRMQNDIRKKILQIIFVIIGLAIPAAILIFSNYIVYGNILGMRSFQIIDSYKQNFPLHPLNIISSLFHYYIFMHPIRLGLFIVWPIFLFAIFIFNKNARLKNNYKFIRLLAFITFSYYIIIPILITIPDGMILGPRFLAPLQPLLVIITFYLIETEYYNSKKWKILFIILSIYSAVLLFTALTFQYIHKINFYDLGSSINRDIREKIIILFEPTTTETTLQAYILPLFNKKMIYNLKSADDFTIIFEQAKKRDINQFDVIYYKESEKKFNHIMKMMNVSSMSRKAHLGYKGLTCVITENIKLR